MRETMNVNNFLATAGSFGSDLWMDTFLSSVVYALLGLVLFAITFLVITKATPFSLRKEIEEDQNTALAIMIGSVMIGLSIILGASIAG
jgi:putative membrane protein